MSFSSSRIRLRYFSGSVSQLVLLVAGAAVDLARSTPGRLGDVQVLVRVAAGGRDVRSARGPAAEQRRDDRDDQDADDDAQRQAGADLDDVDGLAVVDERQVVLVQGVQDQLDADEGQDRGQPVGQVDRAGPAGRRCRKYSWRRPSRENAVAVKTMYTFWVRPKMAGIESSANRMSVPPMATITSSIGVSDPLAV